VVVVLLNGELDLSTGVGVSQTQLSTTQITRLQLLQKLVSVKTKSTDQVLDDLIGLAINTGESGLDGRGQVLVCNSEDDLLLLSSLGKVNLEERQKVRVSNSLRDVVGVLERLGGTPTYKSGD
jgi:hypothetical protein